MYSYIRTRSYFVAFITLFILGIAFLAMPRPTDAACAAPTLGTAYTVSASCTFAELIQGSDAGIVINVGQTLTANAGQTIVWAPGSALVINGSIAISSTGKLQQTYMWHQDQDSDGYPDQTRLFIGATSPGTGYRQRSVMSTSTAIDAYPTTNTCTTGGTCSTTGATFASTGAEQTYVVPSGVTSIQVDARGAYGGIGNYSNGYDSATNAFGARVQTTLSVTPGETLYIYVGKPGIDGVARVSTGTAGGWNGGGNGGNASTNGDGGGGGGGASDVRQGGNLVGNRVVVAGGGGGNGATANGSNTSSEATGGAGGQTGSSGVDCSSANSGGRGGTASAAGAAGVACQFEATGNPGVAGSGATGGTGGLNSSNGGGGGGGGGGYFGGGGGGGGEGSTRGAGGGGGSSYSAGTSTTYTSNYSATGPQVIITLPVAASTSSLCYIDSDADTFGSDFAYTCSGTLPSGMVTNGTDCDDATATLYQNLTGYGDGDGDTVRSTTGVLVCSGASLPAAYSATVGTDCNDANATLYQNLTGYPDADVDTVFSPTGVSVCSGASLPAAYSATVGTDCNDANATLYQNLTGYLNVDADADTYRLINSSQQVCSGGSLPSGYNSTAGTDCLDSNANVYQNVANLVTDADNDIYPTATAAATQCVGTTSTINTRTYYKNASAAFTWCSNTVCTGATDGNDANATLGPLPSEKACVMPSGCSGSWAVDRAGSLSACDAYCGGFTHTLSACRTAADQTSPSVYSSVDFNTCTFSGCPILGNNTLCWAYGTPYNTGFPTVDPVTCTCS